MDHMSSIPDGAMSFKAPTGEPGEGKKGPFKVRFDKDGSPIDAEEEQRRRGVNAYFDKIVVSPRAFVEGEEQALTKELEALSAKLATLTEAAKDPNQLSDTIYLMDAKSEIKTAMEKLAIVKGRLEKADLAAAA